MTRGLLFGCVAAVLGGCMTNAFAVKIGQDAERFTVDGERLGSGTKEVLALATEKYGRQPVCTMQKSGEVAVKKARNQETCAFSSLEGVMFAEQKVIEARYTFINGRFEQLDLEIVEITDNSKDALLQELGNSLNVSLEVEGPVTKWTGKNDSAMLVRQGNYKFRMTNRVYLPEDINYNKLTVRR